MRIDTTQVSFSGKGNGSELARFNVKDAHEFQVLVTLNSFTGTPSSFVVSIYPVEDIVLTDAVRSSSYTATPVTFALISGRAVIGDRPWIPNVFKTISIRLTLNGGTTPTAAGNVKCFTKTI